MDNSDSSDTSDEDYIPNEGEVVSEEEDSGDEEHFIPDEDDDGADNKESVSKCKRPRKHRQIISSDPCTKSNHKVTSQRTRQRSQEDDNKCNDKQFITQNEEIKEQVKKNKADTLWADFMKDVGTIKTKPKLSSDPISSKATESAPASSVSLPTSSSSSASAATSSNKVTIVQEYNFAGETVMVTKELDVSSKEAQEALSSSALKPEPQPAAVSSSSSSAKPTCTTLKRPSGGLNSVLSKLNKKPKLSTLEKSKLDWDGFKQKEGITEELQIHNRGKGGYLERVAFLERTDQRQYEIERNLRLGSSQKQ